MRAPIPRLLFICVMASVLLSCQRSAKPKLSVQFGISPKLTHLAVGQVIRLSAYKIEGNTTSERASQGTTALPLMVNVMARWSVSDTSLMTVVEDGTLKALKPGRVTVTGRWNGLEAATAVEIMSNLPVAALPQIGAQGTQCQPQTVSLALEANRALDLRIGFGNSQCDLEVSAQAPTGSLPWKFNFNGGAVELLRARGQVVEGQALLKDGGRITFTTWSNGDGVYPITLTGKTVLLVGDSMAEGLGWYLRDRVESAGGRYIGEPWSSSTIPSWNETGRFKQMLARYNPDVVFIALGSNEIFLKEPRGRVPLIKQMTQELGTRPAYWIGPPSWKPDRGIVHIIEENFQPGRFYNSNDLKVPRAKDGAHPTRDGYKTWVELVWNWYARIG